MTYNRGRTSGLADGIVITPSHNPPEDGGIKYNPPHGGPSETAISSEIEKRANELLARAVKTLTRVPIAKARTASTTHRHDYVSAYAADLVNVVDMDAIRSSKLHIGVDPLGGAAVAYWAPIAERYGLNLEIVNKEVDPTFRFMTLDWDGRIRMDCSSPHAMANLIALKETFRHRVRQRCGHRSSRHRHALLGFVESKSLPCSGDRLSLHTPPAVGRESRDRQDGREFKLDRSRSSRT